VPADWCCVSFGGLLAFDLLGEGLIISQSMETGVRGTIHGNRFKERFMETGSRNDPWKPVQGTIM
jgi:hypothetical protein